MTTFTLRKGSWHDWKVSRDESFFAINYLIFNFRACRPFRDNRGAIITIKSCFHWTIVAIKAKSDWNLSLLSR